MPVGISDLQNVRELGVIKGRWHIALHSELNESLGPVRFRDGRTVEPVSGLIMQGVVAAMGSSVRALVRVDPFLVIGDESAGGEFVEGAPKVDAQAPDVGDDVDDDDGPLEDDDDDRDEEGEADDGDELGGEVNDDATQKSEAAETDVNAIVDNYTKTELLELASTTDVERPDRMTKAELAAELIKRGIL